MRATLMVALATLAGAGSLRAQHGSAYEFGFFGSYTHYDPAFGLPERFGGGIRFGYLFGDVVQVEADVVFPSEYTVGSSKVDPLIGGASLIVNVLHSQRNILYVSAGYSRLEFGNTNPYEFSDNGAHAAVGDRIFFSRNMALRLEARGIYTPNTQSNFGKESVTHFVGTVGLSIFAPSRKAAKAPPPAPAPAAPAAAPLPTPPLLMMDSDQDGVLEKDDSLSQHAARGQGGHARLLARRRSRRGPRRDRPLSRHAQRRDRRCHRVRGRCGPRRRGGRHRPVPQHTGGRHGRRHGVFGRCGPRWRLGWTRQMPRLAAGGAGRRNGLLDGFGRGRRGRRHR